MKCTYTARVCVLSGVRLAKFSALATRVLLPATVLPKARRGFCAVRRLALTALAMSAGWWTVVLVLAAEKYIITCMKT